MSEMPRDTNTGMARLPAYFASASRMRASAVPYTWWGRFNAYRVLLTRGRDGVAVFVPPSPDMESTFVALCRAGFESVG
jgi:hypothetical protein